MNGALFKKPRKNRCCPERHGGDASTPVSLRFAVRRDPGLPPRPLLPARCRPQRADAKHTDIDHQRSQAGALNPLTQEGELLSLGVERADQRNGLGDYLRSSR